MELEVKEGVVVNPRDEQKKLVIELARRVAAQRVGDNLDVITDKIAGKFAGYLSKKSTAEANAAEFEVAMEDAKGIVKEILPPYNTREKISRPRPSAPNSMIFAPVPPSLPSPKPKRCKSEGKSPKNLYSVPFTKNSIG